VGLRETPLKFVQLRRREARPVALLLKPQNGTRVTILFVVCCGVFVVVVVVCSSGDADTADIRFKLENFTQFIKFSYL